MCFIYPCTQYPGITDLILLKFLDKGNNYKLKVLVNKK